MIVSSEIWLAVPEYEGIYEVSSHGKVRSLTRQIARTGGDPHTRRGRVMKPVANSQGYMVVTLRANGRKSSKRVHHLVLLAFVGPRPEGTWGLHNDDVKSNNHVDNLYWGTPAHNARDRIDNGHHFQVHKTHCPRGHALVEPNLKRAQLVRGRRDCLACGRAHNAVRLNENLDFASAADWYYDRLLAGVTGRQVPPLSTSGGRKTHA